MINKKGQAAAILGFLLLGVVVVFMLRLTAVPMLKVWDDISVELKKPAAFGTDNITVGKIEQVDNFIAPAYDQLIFLALFGLLLTLLIVAVFTDVHPIFLVFLLIGLIVIVIVTAELVNVSEDAMSNPALNNTASQLTMSNTVTGTMLPIIVLFVGGIALLILMKRGSGGGA